MVISCAVDFTDQQEDFCLITPVEINQRRATIECVLVSNQIFPFIQENLVAIFKPFNIIAQPTGNWLFYMGIVALDKQFTIYYIHSGCFLEQFY